MTIVINILLLVLGFAMLSKGSDWFVDGAAGIATKLKIPQLVIGLTIVAMGTSAPEAAVSITAAINGNAEITVGNIVGSNILNILIILGLASVIVPIAVAKSTVKIDIPFTIAVTLLLLLFGYTGGTIVLWEGIVFLVLFAAYLTYLFIMAKKSNTSAEEAKELSVPKALIFTVVGLAIIIIGSNVTVDAATVIAESIGISQKFIALTVVALGTSLPELFTSVTAARKGNADIAIGNIVGSNIFNILMIVGVSSVIIPVPFIDPSIDMNFIFDTIIAAVAALILLLCSIKGKLKRWAGIFMLVCYAAYFVVII